MKKLKYFILIAVLCLVSFNCVNALTCEYSDGKLNAAFKLNEKENTVGKAMINGKLKSKDETKIENEEQSIENWITNFDAGKIKFKGFVYFSDNKKCPPYSIFVDRRAQFDFAVFDDSYYDEFEKYGKSKQGYAIMKLIEETGKDNGDVEYYGTSCVDYTEKQSCEENPYFSCVWNEYESLPNKGYCNTDKLQYVRCGDAFDIPHQIPEIISLLVNLLKIGTPIILILVSIISLLKALSSSTEDEIKKAQKGLIRKLIAAVMVFFVISIVQFVILKVADTDDFSGVSEADNFSSCLTCFLNNDCEETLYFKTNVLGEYQCTYFSDLQHPVKCD